MAALLFDSLEIRGFRAFQDLRIEKLGRVNLIVGQNNIGKSCLLEALQLYAQRAHPSLLWHFLEIHDEDTRSSDNPLDQNVDELLSIVKNLFYGRPEMTGRVPPIEIGPINSPEATLRLSVGFNITKVDEQGQTIQQLLSLEEFNGVEHAIPCFFVQLGENRHAVYPLEPTLGNEPLKSEIQPIPCVMPDTNGLNKRAVSELWDRIASTDLRNEVPKALRILGPNLEGVSIVGDMGTKRERFPIVTTSSTPNPLPIRTLGTGMQRVFSIVLALLNAKDGLLLIDEIEHGLHYTAQVELWLLIFEIAHRLNIQVFATSHSWDCIVSFQAAIEEFTQKDKKNVQEDKQIEAMLFRLSFKTGKMLAVMYDADKLAIAARQDIEVR
jgi:ABC-type transport system involved in cytochrome c biogenesis ATPase subunit